MLKMRVRCLVALLAICLFANSYAQVVTGLARATVAVANRDDSALAKALPQAMGEVLVRMSGNDAVMTLPALQNDLNNLNRFVVSYRFIQNPQANATLPWQVEIRFDQTALKKLLRDHGQAIWSANRPQTLLWLSVPQMDQTSVLSAGDQTKLLNTVEQVATLRGLPYLLPTMDLQDQTNEPADISQLPTDPALQQEATRYGVESVLAVAMVSDDNSDQLTAQWKLLLDGAPYTWQSTGDDVAKLLRAGLNSAADMMANRLATLANPNLQSQVLMQVQGINSLQDYSTILKKLKQLAPVSSVKVVDMGQHDLLLSVAVAGGSETLAQALKMIARLHPATVATSSLQPADLYYLWEQPHVAAISASS